MAVFVTEFLHFYAMRNALYIFCLRAERDQLLVVCSLFAGRNVINYLLYHLCLRGGT